MSIEAVRGPAGGAPGVLDDAPETRGPGDDAPLRHERRILYWCAVGWMALVIVAAIVADWLPFEHWDVAAGSPRLEPFQDWGEPLGTDNYGRSILSRLVYGARASLVVGVGAATIGLVIGGLLGLVAGYVRGKVDAVVSFVIDTLLAFPPLVILLSLATVLRPSVSTLLVGLTLLVIPTMARLERAAALNWSQRPFVTAARSYGAGHLRLLFREVLPNSGLVLVTYAPTVMAALIVAEGALSFLGLGIPPPDPSWGGMIAEGKTQLRTAPHLVFVPAVTLFITVLALNAIGEGVRARLESR